jgi:hypothetical protein
LDWCHDEDSDEWDEGSDEDRDELDEDSDVGSSQGGIKVATKRIHVLTMMKITSTSRKASPLGAAMKRQLSWMIASTERTDYWNG